MLGLSKQRVYQLDAELTPLMVRRGEKMVARWYRPDVVAAFRERRALAKGGAPKRDAGAVARTIAARVLEEYATRAPFFVGVDAVDTEAVRVALLDIATHVRR